jgi:hypothetical protein
VGTGKFLCEVQKALTDTLAASDFGNDQIVHVKMSSSRHRLDLPESYHPNE